MTSFSIFLGLSTWHGDSSTLVAFVVIIKGVALTWFTPTLPKTSWLIGRLPSKLPTEQCKHYSTSQELLGQSKSQSLETWKVPKQIWKLKKVQNLKLCKGTIGGAMSQKVENWNKTHLENHWMIMWNWRITMKDALEKLENEHEWFRV